MREGDKNHIIDPLLKTMTLLSHGCMTSAGVLKLWISTFLMEFGFLNLEFGNQIWKFICSYFGKFSGQFLKISNFLEFEFFNELKLEFS